MQEVPFTLSLSGVIKIEADKITISIGKTKTIVELGPSPKTDARLFLRKGQTIFDVILNTAQNYTVSHGKRSRFSAAELYHLAKEQYPHLKRNSWTAHMIASAPEHSSYRHYGVTKDYFAYLGKGTYQLRPAYLIGNTEDET